MIRATYRLNAVDDMNATLTVTMRVKDWKEFQAKLPEAWPAWEFSAKISEMLRHANEVFDARQGSES